MAHAPRATEPPPPGPEAPDLPTWGVAWTDAGPGYDSRLRCEVCHRCVYYTHATAYAAREMMRRHIEEEHTPNGLVVFCSPAKGGWQAKHTGPWAKQIRALFTTDTLPLPWTPDADAYVVMAALRAKTADPSVEITLRDDYAPARCLRCGAKYFHADDCPTPAERHPAVTNG